MVLPGAEIDPKLKICVVTVALRLPLRMAIAPVGQFITTLQTGVAIRFHTRQVAKPFVQLLTDPNGVSAAYYPGAATSTLQNRATNSASRIVA